MSNNLDRNILALADEIGNQRSEEKARQYGPFGEGMERAAAICSGMTGKDFTAHDMFAALIALKFSRQSYNHKQDNLLDAAAYIGAWQNYINKNKKTSQEKNIEANNELFNRSKPPSRSGFQDPEIRGPDTPSRLVPPSEYSTSIDPKGK